MIPDWLIRHMMAFVLGFSLMCMYLGTREVMAGHFWILLQSNGQ